MKKLIGGKVDFMKKVQLNRNNRSYYVMRYGQLPKKEAINKNEKEDKSGWIQMKKKQCLLMIMLIGFFIAIIGNQTAYAANNYSINGVYYDSLSDAYDSITTTSKVTIKVEVGGISNYGFTIASNRSVSINTNGLTTYLLEPIINEGSLSITGSGSIINETSWVIANNSTSNVMLVSATLSGTYGAIQNNSTGSINIASGTVSSTHTYAIHNTSTGKINVAGGSVVCTGHYRNI